MLTKTNGIVLRATKYGDTSLIVTIFTQASGIQAYIQKGIRGSGAKQNKAAFFQPGMLLDLVVYRNPQKQLQVIRDYQATHIYSTVQESMVKNSVLIFSVELLLRLLPEGAPIPFLFDFASEYFITLDKIEVSKVANFPLYFIINCSRILGYEVQGTYSEETPFLNMQEGSFTDHSPASIPFTTDEDARQLNILLGINDYPTLAQIEMNSPMRLRLLDWFISFLQCHTQHMGKIKSLVILQTILH